MKFDLQSEYQPAGDQPQAIAELVEGVNNGTQAQTLLGVTGSGKTFTMANVIAKTGRPTLVLSHNKTLAAQLYSEFKEFFPNNLVEYFVSYYDYYQPEAYIPTTNTYIEKDLAINEEIEKLRLSTTSALLSGRRDVIVVASISCIYGIGNPVEFHKSVIPLKVGQKWGRNAFLHTLVSGLYSRTRAEFKRGTFRVQGDTVDIFLAYADHALRVHFWGDEIEQLETIDPESGTRLHGFDDIIIYPANLFVSSKSTTDQAVWEIQQDLEKQKQFFTEQAKYLEAKRLEERTLYDLEMIKEIGFCNGIENYSRYFDRRQPGERPFCLLDYFADDFLLVVDESHVTVPQIGAMFGGDRSRKTSLVEYGFRLPSALDNRPLKADEFDTITNQVVYVSATPADYELEQSEGIIVEQVIRPQWSVVQGRWQAKSVFHQRGLARTVTAEHCADLRHRHVAFINDEQKVISEVVEQAERTLAGLAPVEVAAVILDAVAESNFLDHLQVVQRALFEALGFEVFGLFGEELLLLFEVLLDFPHGLIGGGFAGDEQVGRVDDDVVKPVQPRPGFRVNGFQLLDLVAPEVHTQRVVGVGQENVNGISLDSERAALELGTRAAVEATDQRMKEGVAAPLLSHLQRNHALMEFHRIADAVDAADGCHDDDVAPAAEQR